MGRSKTFWSAAGAAAVITFSPALGDGRCEREINRNARTYNVPPALLFAVALNESGSAKGLRPYAMNIDGASAFPSSLAEARRRFDDARRAGARFIDIGCMQINHRFHGHAFASLEAMFDPAANVRYAARFLAELRARHGSWTMALARYHAGPSNTPAQRRYICAAIGQLVRTGLGVWTPQARDFCRTAQATGRSPLPP